MAPIDPHSIEMPSSQLFSLQLFVSAFVLGLLFNVVPGTIFAETVRRGLNGGFKPALNVQLGSLSGDLIWVVLGMSGAMALLSLPMIQTPLALFGAGLLIWFACLSFRDAMSIQQFEMISRQPEPSMGKHALLAGIVLSISNPLNVTYWAAIGGAVTVITGEAPTWHDFAIFVFGFMVSSILWCFICAGAIAWTRQHISRPLWKALHICCGIGMVAISSLIIIRLLPMPH